MTIKNPLFYQALLLMFIAMISNAQAHSVLSLNELEQTEEQFVEGRSKPFLSIPLQCQKTGPLSWNICWETSLNSEIIYHIFASKQWQDLKPLASPLLFFQSSDSQEYLCYSTSEASFEISHYPYVRIIAYYNNQFFDVAPLITLYEPDPLENISFAPHFFRHLSVAEDTRLQNFPFISKEIWDQVYPFLLTSDHPIKNALDKLFSDFHLLSSVDSLKKAGFEIIWHRVSKGLIVVRHPKLERYLLKLYLNSATRAEWPLWLLRIKGASLVQSIIDKHNNGRYLKVAKKWIYAIPRNPVTKPSGNEFHKNFVLVVEDMRPLRTREHHRKLHREMTHSLMEALFVTINEGGLSDSHPNNIPFCEDGKIVFIDTEYVNNWPVHFEWLTPYFSRPMQEYWKKLISKRH